MRSLLHVDSRFDAIKRDREDELILTETGFEFVGKPLSAGEYGRNNPFSSEVK